MSKVNASGSHNPSTPISVRRIIARMSEDLKLVQQYTRND